MHNHNFTDKEWPFDFPVDLGVITTKQVMYEDHPITVVLHDEDNDWQFLCGTTNNPDDGMVVCMGCLFDKFRYLEIFNDLKPGWEASRETEDSAWEINEIEWDEN